MKLSTLIAELNDTSSQWLSRCQNNVDIFSYELYLPDTFLQPGVVYICDFSALPQEAPANTSFFCFAADDTLVHIADCNIVSFDGDMTSLLGNVGRQMTIDHKLQTDKQTLMEALNTGNGLQYLIDAAYKMLRSPIIVVDSAYKIIAMNSAVIEDRPDLELQRQLGYMMDINIASMKQFRLYEKTRQNKYPYYSVEPTFGVGWLTALIYVYGIEAAQMGIMEHSHEFTHYDYELSHFLCQLISLELQKDDFYKHNQGLMHSTLLADLLGGRLLDKTARARVHQLGWTLSDFMYVLTIFDRTYGVFDHKAQVICEQIHQMYTSSRWVILENKIVFLLILSKDEDEELRSGSILKEYLVTNKLTASVSECFSDLFAVRWKYVQCNAAFEMGTQLKPGNELYLYRDYQVHHIGAVVMKDLPSGVLFHPGVIAMERHDRQNDTEFLVTLKEYFRYINDPSAVATKLFIHKNTLFYRINKAKELFGFDLNDGYERLRIYMTMIFMEL